MRIKFLKDANYPQIKPDGSPDPERSKSYKAGEIHDLPDDHANRWLRRNAAVEVKDETAKPKETLVKEAPAKESLVPGPAHKGHGKSEAL